MEKRANGSMITSNFVLRLFALKKGNRVRLRCRMERFSILVPASVFKCHLRQSCEQKHKERSVGLWNWQRMIPYHHPWKEKWQYAAVTVACTPSVCLKRYY